MAFASGDLWGPGDGAVLSLGWRVLGQVIIAVIWSIRFDSPTSAKRAIITCLSAGLMSQTCSLVTHGVFPWTLVLAVKASVAGVFQGTLLGPGPALQHEAVVAHIVSTTRCPPLTLSAAPLPFFSC